MKSALRTFLMERGAALAGIGAVDEGLSPELSHLNRAICIAVDRRLNEDTIGELVRLQKEAARWLRGRGWRFLPLPPDSDRITDTFISRLYGLFSHKTAATCSGLGWVGRNGLLVHPAYGPRLSFATVLTNAPIEPDEPVARSGCGECRLCVEHCPAGAISGAEWSRENPFPRQVDYERCRSHQGGRRVMTHKPPCGLCVTICPYGRKAAHGTEPGGQTNERHEPSAQEDT